jgi:hypothetical protein
MRDQRRIYEAPEVDCVLGGLVMDMRYIGMIACSIEHKARP